MDHDYEDLGADFNPFPGVDLRLWLLVIAIAVGAVVAAVGIALTVG